MSGLRRISSRGARPVSNPIVPRLPHRHKKVGLPHLVLNRRATSMLLPRALPIRQIRLPPNRTTIRLTKRRRTRRRTSCPRHAQFVSIETCAGEESCKRPLFYQAQETPICSDRRLIGEGKSAVEPCRVAPCRSSKPRKWASISVRMSKLLSRRTKLALPIIVLLAGSAIFLARAASAPARWSTFVRPTRNS
jgi:hypothetical protein